MKKVIIPAGGAGPPVMDALMEETVPGPSTKSTRAGLNVLLEQCSVIRQLLASIYETLVN